MFSKAHPIIIYIDRTGFSVYQDTLANIPKFNFTSDLVANLDVVNREQFVILVKTFIQINKIIPSGLVVILSDDAIYVKDLVNQVQQKPSSPELKQDSNNDNSNNGEDEVQNFLENVPFEEILAKVIKAGGVNRAIAANKDLVMSIVDTFVENGSSLEAISPCFMYGQSANFATGLTPDNVQVILGNTEALRLGNLLTNQEKMIPMTLESQLKSPSTDTVPIKPVDAKKTKNTRQYILIGVFVILLVILGIVYFTAGSSQTPSRSKTKNVSANSIITPTILPIEPSPTIIAVPLNLSNMKVKIVQDSSENAIGAFLKNELLKMGIVDVSIEASGSAVPDKSAIVFSQNIPVNSRSSIITEIKKILPDVTILENQDPGFTINVLVGRS